MKSKMYPVYIYFFFLQLCTKKYKMGKIFELTSSWKIYTVNKIKMCWVLLASLGKCKLISMRYHFSEWLKCDWLQQIHWAYKTPIVSSIAEGRKYDKLENSIRFLQNQTFTYIWPRVFFIGIHCWPYKD